jgi:hypothetical protein
MKRSPALLLVLLFSLAFTLNASAVTFDFTFDNDPTAGIQSPIVGTGSFTFANDPGTGTFAFNSLGAFTVSFAFSSGATFTQADILSDLSQVLVIISPDSGGRTLKFSDTGAGSGGPFGGSLDFINGSGAGLSFEPSYFGGNLDLYFSDNNSEETGTFGTYLATNGRSVPEGSASVWLAMFSFVSLAALQRLGRRYAAVRRRR